MRDDDGWLKRDGGFQKWKSIWIKKIDNFIKIEKKYTYAHVLTQTRISEGVNILSSYDTIKQFMDSLLVIDYNIKNINYGLWILEWT